jgi:hypothetical protein
MKIKNLSLKELKNNMMKNIFIIIFILMSINLVWGQSLCPPNGITTNPDNPNNTQNPTMENDFFDWRIEDFNNYFDPLAPNL